MIVTLKRTEIMNPWNIWYNHQKNDNSRILTFVSLLNVSGMVNSCFLKNEIINKDDNFCFHFVIGNSQHYSR